MTKKELLLFTVKQYIERFMFEGSKYNLTEQDRWVKQLYSVIEEQQKEIQLLKLEAKASDELIDQKQNTINHLLEQLNA